MHLQGCQVRDEIGSPEQLVVREPGGRKIVAAVLGAGAMFLLLAMGSFDAATASNLILYQLLWLIPVIVLNFGLKR